MEIASVKLVNAGLKGIEVTYAQASSKDGRSFIDEHKSKKKAPIHSELEDAFEDLRVPLLDICGYEEPEGLIHDVEMTQVKYSEKGFVLSGVFKVLDGERTIDLVTPLIRDGNEYKDFVKVASILDRIYDETRSYMSGEKSMSDEQLVLKFNSDNDGFDADTFFKLSKDEQREIATKILQDQGSIVFHPEEGEEESEEPIIAPVMNVVKDEVNFDMEDDFELDEDSESPFVKETVLKKKAYKEPALKMVDGPNGSFSIVENESKKVSTAKKVG